MMCSSWKISVFGILALMLAFGLAAPDALAAKTEVGIAADKGVSTTGDVFAGVQVDIVFTVSVGSTVSDGDDDKAGTVNITIPSVWSRPFSANSATVDEVGEVVIGATTGSGDTVVSGKVEGRKLVASLGKDATGGTLTFTFRTIAPPRTGKYLIPVSSATHTILSDVNNAASGISSLTVVVGPTQAGAGKLELTPLKPQAGDDKEPVTEYRGKYLLVSEQTLENLKITFTAPGTLPKGSVVKFTSEGFKAFDQLGSSQISFSGNVEIAAPNTDHDAQNLSLTVKDGGIQKNGTVVFSIPSYYKAPKIAATADGGVQLTAIETGYTMRVTTSIPEQTDVAGTEVDFGAQTETSVGAAAGNTDAQYDFYTTKDAGTGKAVVYSGSSGTTELKYAVADAAIADTQIRITFPAADLQGIGRGAKFQVEIPSPFAVPFQPIGANTANGATTATDLPTGTVLKISGRTISGDLPPNPSSGTTPPTITYRVDKAPLATGEYEFKAKASAGSHRPDMKDIASPKIEVVVGAGKGDLKLTKGGQTFNHTTSEKEVGDLVFTFTAQGRMAKDSTVTIAGSNPAGWPAFRSDNGDGVADAGEVKLLSGAASLTSVATGLITATTTGVLEKGATLSFTYRNVKAPKQDTPQSFTFQGQSNSYSGEALANTASSPSVGIGREPDGAGAIALNKTTANAGDALADFTITYTASGTMTIGSQVEVSVPDNWTGLSLKDFSTTTDDVPGRVTLADRSSVLVVDSGGKKMTATTQIQLGQGDVIKFIIKKATAPAADGQYTFTAKSTSDPSGVLTALSTGGTTLTVSAVSAGTISLASATAPLMSAAPGMALGNLAFTFTAGTRMEAGAQVKITVPTGWDAPFLDNNDGTDAAGEVSLAGMADLSVSGGGTQPWVLTATTNAVLESGNTLTITYKQVTAADRGRGLHVRDNRVNTIR